MLRQSLVMVSILACSPASQNSSLEPVVGGPCDGCELVFEGKPTHLQERARIGPTSEPGEPMAIEGTVRRRDGTVAAGVIVYAYHTDSQGIYPRGSTRHGRLRAWAKTNAEGYYRFDTIRPGAYPDNANPQHVHMHIIEPGKVTYVISDVVFDDDPLRQTARHNRQDQPDLGGSGLTHPKKDSRGVWRVRRDIVLGHNVPGYKG